MVGSCKCRNGISGSTKTQGVSRSGEQLSASHGGHCSLKVIANVIMSYFRFAFSNTLVSNIFRVKVASELSTVTNTVKENCQLQCNPQVVSWRTGFGKCSI